jgi:hypothetical protein
MILVQDIAYSSKRELKSGRITERRRLQVLHRLPRDGSLLLQWAPGGLVQEIQLWRPPLMLPLSMHRMLSSRLCDVTQWIKTPATISIARGQQQPLLSH